MQRGKPEPAGSRLIRVTAGEGGPRGARRDGAAARTAMREHLSDSDMTALMTDTRAADWLEHVRRCAVCRTEWRRLHAALTGLAEQIHREAVRPEVFFQAQCARIIRGLGEPRPRPGWRRILWAPALTATALLLIFLTRGGPLVPRPRAAEADRAFLTVVEHSIYTEVSGPLRPAALLAAEVERTVLATDRRNAAPKGEQR
jgi:hypothetical protein